MERLLLKFRADKVEPQLSGQTQAKTSEKAVESGFGEALALALDEEEAENAERDQTIEAVEQGLHHFLGL